MTLGDAASAYRYADVASAGVVNDRVGSQPIAVFAEAETGQINVFSASLPGEGFSLTFHHRGRRFVDAQTGSTWSQFTGRATEGPLEGRRLQRLAVCFLLRLGMGRFLSPLKALRPARPAVGRLTEHSPPS